MNIDWSKAPAWASAVGTVSGGSPAWISDEGYCFLGIANPPCHPYKGKNYTRDSFTIVARRPWTGEGLPPVGTVCEYKGLTCGTWMRCEVLAHRNNAAVVIDDSYVCELVEDRRLRPLRTSEQIAAEERREAIESLAGELGGHWSEEAKAPHRIMATYLHDIGYRKQVQP